MKERKEQSLPGADVVPLFGRDEMNLVEFPFGPITTQGVKTFEVKHPVYDKTLKREVTRKLLITGSDAFGLPKPIDDQVLMGMKALTYEAGFQSRKVEFSRYHLCRTIGWPTDGRAYKRLEDSLDRIAGTTLKFKDSWWDKGESEWKSKTFHLIEDVEICSRDRLDRMRQKARRSAQQLCSFVWGEVVWKSFEDGFIKKLDMEMFRKIGYGRRREVPLRLYRILDKRFYRQRCATFDVRHLCVGILGVNDAYAPSQMVRILERSAQHLVACGFLHEMRTGTGKSGRLEATFIKAGRMRRESITPEADDPVSERSNLLKWFDALPTEKQERIQEKALSYCREHQRSLSDGYLRTQAAGNSTCHQYREMMVEAYLEERLRKTSKAA